MPVRISVIGPAKECGDLINKLIHINGIQIASVFFSTPAPAHLTQLCTRFRILQISTYDKLTISTQDLILLFSPTEYKSVPDELRPFTVPVNTDTAASLMPILSVIMEKLTRIEEQKEKYLSALNAATEGVQILNEKGIIEYVNPAFSKITGIHPTDRIGTNAFEVSPDGSGAQVLKTGKPATGVRNQSVGSCADVISNGAPILINGKSCGAVVVFQEVTDILRLSQELRTSKALIESLSTELGKTKSSKYKFKDLIGTNKKLLEAINISKRAANNDSTILITGESGTGKEIIAHAIHHASKRWNMPFITVNCASIPDSLIENELFGHEKGSFTGADRPKMGKFEIANSGTIFLDEIGDLNFNVQAKLLRVLQEKEVERIGGSERFPIDVKIIAATNQNLAEMVSKGTFRADLFYRLQVITVQLPPLRERTDDIPALVESIVAKLCHTWGKPLPVVDASALHLLRTYTWPGNIRELENVLTKALMLCDGGILSTSNFAFLYKAPSQSLSNSNQEDIIPLNKLEKEMISRALFKFGQSTDGKKAAANSLNISLGTLYNKIKLYNLGGY